MVDILLGHGYAWELDWKCELDDLRFALGEIRKKNREAEDLTEALSDGTFDEDEDLTAWCAGLSEACPRHTVGCLGIDSDSYVIFPVQKQILDQLQQAAGQIGQKITPAENG